MAVVRIVRFTVEPGRSREMQERRADLIAETSRRFPGLTETRLARVDEDGWVDQWRWESAGHMQAALDGVATIPGAREAFAVVTDARAEVAEIVDEKTGSAR
ncbi:MAG: hypothetical protein HOY69_31585 [Streptomyces sp.]|nr:hypothetical protein [Streptomyces sp.]